RAEEAVLETLRAVDGEVLVREVGPEERLRDPRADDAADLVHGRKVVPVLAPVCGRPGEEAHAVDGRGPAHLEDGPAGLDRPEDDLPRHPDLLALEHLEPQLRVLTAPAAPGLP